MNGPRSKIAALGAIIVLIVSSCASDGYVSPAGVTAETGATVLGSKKETNLLVQDQRTVISGIDGQPTRRNVHQWDTPVLVPPGLHTIQVLWRQTPMTGSIAFPITLEMGKTYVARSVKLDSDMAQVWIEETGTGAAVSERLTMCLSHDAPIMALFSRCK